MRIWHSLCLCMYIAKDSLLEASAVRKRTVWDRGLSCPVAFGMSFRATWFQVLHIYHVPRRAFNQEVRKRHSQIRQMARGDMSCFMRCKMIWEHFTSDCPRSQHSALLATVRLLFIPCPKEPGGLRRDFKWDKAATPLCP